MLIPIDFEFNSSHKKNINVVCVSLHDPEMNQTFTYWLHNNPDGRAAAAGHIHQLGYAAGHTFLTFLASAENRRLKAENEILWKKNRNLRRNQRNRHPTNNRSR
jgi:hypothetical protein